MSNIHLSTQYQKKRKLEMKWNEHEEKLLQLEATFHLWCYVCVCVYVCNMLLVIGIHVPNKTTIIKVMLSITPLDAHRTWQEKKPTTQFITKHESSVKYQPTHTHTHRPICTNLWKTKDILLKISSHKYTIEIIFYRKWFMISLLSLCFLSEWWR